MENKVTISELPELASVSGTESIPVDSYDSVEEKNKTLRVSVDEIKNFIESGLTSTLELKADVKSNFEVVTSDGKTITNADLGKTLFVTDNCTLTVSDYDSFDDGFNCVIIIYNDYTMTVEVEFTGTDSARCGSSRIERDTTLFKSPNAGEFIIFGQYPQY